MLDIYNHLNNPIRRCTQDAAICLQMRDEMQRLLTENIILRKANESLQVMELQSFVANDEKVRLDLG